MKELLNILAHGDDTQLAGRVYNTESLSDSARQIPVILLRTLHAPRPDMRLTVVERHPSGRFELVILRIPWAVQSSEPGSGYHPLLVAEQAGELRAVGFVLPWNEVIPQLGAEMNSILPLSMVWITRLNAFKAGASSVESS